MAAIKLLDQAERKRQRLLSTGSCFWYKVKSEQIARNYIVEDKKSLKKAVIANKNRTNGLLEGPIESIGKVLLIVCKEV